MYEPLICLLLKAHTILLVPIRPCPLLNSLSPAVLFILCIRLVYISTVSPITFTVTENCAKDTIVGDMSVYKTNASQSLDQKTKIFVLDSLGTEEYRLLFAIDSSSGIIRVNKRIDREEICPQLSGTSGTCSISILITIFNDILNIAIIIMDENDNSPIFHQPKVDISIKESTPVGTITFLRHAIDMDSQDNGIGDYQLTSEKQTSPFVLKYNSTVIYLELREPLDYEECQQYQLTLSVCDLGNPKRCSSQQIKILVLDVNDNHPLFQKSKYFSIVTEDYPIGKTVLQLSATDRDSSKFGVVKYRFATVSNDASKFFSLDTINGRIILIQPLSTKYKNFNFIVEAYDNGDIPNTNRTVVTIHVKDINNHAPVIKLRQTPFKTKIVNTGFHSSTVSFYENNPPNTDILFFMVTDKDADENGRVTCVMKADRPNYFELLKFNMHLNKLIYRLTSVRSTDCEEHSRFFLLINCSDSGEDRKFTTHSIHIKIQDENEYPATFNQTLYTGSVRENSLSLCLHLPIIDKDCTSDVTVTIDDEYARSFFRYQQTQQLVLHTPLDHEERAQINFKIKIINRGYGSEPLITSANVEIIVLDVNDNNPILMDPVHFNVTEDSKIGTRIGYLRANDSDSKQNAYLQFHKLNDTDRLADSDGYFLIGSDGEIKLAKELDREKNDKHFIMIAVTDLGSPPLTTTGTVTVFVNDVNDNNPQWVFPSQQDNKLNESIHTAVDVAITRVHALDSDGPGNNNVTYHLISDYSRLFLMNEIKGELSFRKPPKEGKYVLDIVAVDSGNPSRSNRTKLIVYISNKKNDIISGPDLLASRSYFTIVAVVPIFILICILTLILCLLVIVRRRNTRAKNRRSNIKDKGKQMESATPKETLLQSKMIEMKATDSFCGVQPIDTLDLTQTKSMPKVSYQCLVANDLDVCSADSGQGASEDDISNYLMMKQNEHYRIGTYNAHCCSTLPENSIAHFICSTLNHPILYSKTIPTYAEDSSTYLLSAANVDQCNSTFHISPSACREQCSNPLCKRQ